MDLAGAAAGLLLAAPLMAIIAVLIALDSRGPVFFIQERVGKRGKPFRILKFRTMVANAESLLDDLLDVDDLAQPVFKLKDDPRVTGVGRWLRRTSLDELPQFVNVLRGEMSLVGPRPEEKRFVDHYEPWQRLRLQVKPGMTGPMQVRGRGDLALEERVRLEIEYIENYSVVLDLEILLRTLPAVLSAYGAY
jgi:lipopolysaccharide/colanic/teichoic acid biosynthesis glycosyltransferase